MTNDTRLWCIHGNLQLPTVWDPFIDKFYHGPRDDAGARKTLSLDAENLWTSNRENPADWAEDFCLHVRDSHRPGSQILMGYSLGGRLALHATLCDPELWCGVVIISADTGLTSASARRSQLEKDRRWGKRFLSDPWNNVLKDWDSQSVFGNGRDNPKRDENDFSRKSINQVFRRFSKGNQRDLLPAFAGVITPPILYVSGANDARYRKIGDVFAKKAPAVSHVIIENTGHRVPWENPKQFTGAVQSFIDDLNCRSDI